MSITANVTLSPAITANVTLGSTAHASIEGLGIKYNTQSIPAGISTVNFTDRTNQTAYASGATYTLIPKAFDASGIETPVIIVSKTNTGFEVNNETLDPLDLNYITLPL